MFSFHDNSHDTSVFHDEHVDNTTIDGTASDADHDKTENADDTVTDTVHVEADTDQTPHAMACMERHDPSYVVNRSSNELTQHETAVLDRGLSFVPTETRPNKRRLIREFNEFTRLLRIKYYMATDVTLILTTEYRDRPGHDPHGTPVWVREDGLAPPSLITINVHLNITMSHNNMTLAIPAHTTV